MTGAPARTKAVFLDAGHTLMYAHPDVGTIYSDLTAGLGVRLPPESFTKVYFPVFQEFVREYASTSTASDEQDTAMWREILRRTYDRMEGLRGIDFTRWFETLYGHFGEPSVWRLYEDVEPALAALRGAGLRLGIVSNWDTRLKRICAGFALDRRVDFILISAEAGVRKPDPRIFEAALRRAGVRAAEAVHVGDLPEEDVEGARRAGIRPFLIDRRMRLTGTARPAGVPVIRSLGDLLPLIRGS